MRFVAFKHSEINCPNELMIFFQSQYKGHVVIVCSCDRSMSIHSPLTLLLAVVIQYYFFVRLLIITLYIFLSYVFFISYKLG